MCLAIPGKVIRIENGDAVVDYDGVARRASVRLCPDAKIGDRVLVHAGFVMEVLDKKSGEELEKLIAETLGSF